MLEWGMENNAHRLNTPYRPRQSFRATFLDPWNRLLDS